MVYIIRALVCVCGRVERQRSDAVRMSQERLVLREAISEASSSIAVVDFAVVPCLVAVVDPAAVAVVDPAAVAVVDPAAVAVIDWFRSHHHKSEPNTSVKAVAAIC
ncbi:hypothetical protein Nepgr_007172 [Nepenthes gracilis]|uniref:Uncharacterized protein n=1 Tax=Nepenthes gracilis TaxID=150966 RepID=A0AAD3S6D5_NEPGR|nr:hypothetical protein Nepgr_007172 [Nepenthes gracilis]